MYQEYDERPIIDAYLIFCSYALLNIGKLRGFAYEKVLMRLVIGQDDENITLSDNFPISVHFWIINIYRDKHVGSVTLR